MPTRRWRIWSRSVQLLRKAVSSVESSVRSGRARPGAGLLPCAAASAAKRVWVFIVASPEFAYQLRGLLAGRIGRQPNARAILSATLRSRRLTLGGGLAVALVLRLVRLKAGVRAFGFMAFLLSCFG